MCDLALLRASATRNLQTFGGEVSLSMAGVHLYLRPSSEETYIETEDEFDMAVLLMAEEIAQAYGYEVLGENEAPAEELPDGGMRHWLALTEFIEEGENAMAEAS